MNKADQRKALAAAVRAARAAGTVMRQNLHAPKTVNLATAHDIKLELDVRCQKLIARMLHREFPAVALLGEEGDSGDVNAEARWVVDPIDGTVNYAYGIPHAAVSIALQIRSQKSEARGRSTRPSSILHSPSSFKTLLGVIYDPFQDELWTALRGETAKCNGRNIHVSNRKKLEEAVVAIGFAKTRENLRQSLPYFGRLSRRVRKVRSCGSAALALTYVAMGRFDAYIERKISLWDFAAGALIIECAGGKFWHEPVPGHLKYRMVASNGHLHRQLAKPH